MAQTLTEVAVEVFADLRRLKPTTVAAAREAGKAGGDELGDGIVRGADGKLRASQGKFTDSGTTAGKGFEGEIKTGTFAKVLATMAARFALMGGAAAAAAPGVGQLVAALVPAAGAALVLPAALLAIRAASLTAKVAIMGVGDAITAGFGDNAKQAEEALKGLSTNARAFAKQIIDLRPQLEGLQKQVSNRLFKPLLDDIRPTASIYLPLLRQEMSDLAGPLGGIGEQLLETARNGVVVNAVRDIFRNTGLSVIYVRDALDPLITSFATLISTTVPELPKLARGFSDVAERAAAYITTASESGRVTAAFEAGKAVLRDLGGIIGNVGSIIASVYTSATQNGNTLLANLRELTGQAADFFRSAQGGSALTAVFGTLSALGTALRTSLGAVLPAVAAALQVLAPAIAGIIIPASQLVVAVAPLLPFFAQWAATLITKVTPAVAALSGWLTQNEGVIKGVVIAIGLYTAATRIAAAVTAVQAAGSIAQWIAQTTIATNLTRIWTIATGALGAAMKFALGPIGLIIIAVAALVAGIVYAYQHHEGFRNLVQKVWQGIKDAVKATVDWVVGTAWPWLQKAWDGISSGAVAMWQNYIKPAVEAIVSFFRDDLAPAAMWLWNNVLKPAFDGIAAAVRTAMDIVGVALTGATTVFRTVIAPVATWLWKNIIGPAFEGIGWVIKAAMATAELAVAIVVAYYRNVFAPAVTWLWKNIVKPAFDAIGSVIESGIAVGRAALTAAVGFFQKVVAPAVTWLWKNIIAPAFKAIGDAITSGVNTGKAILQLLIDFFNLKVAPVFTWLWKKVVVPAFDGVKSAISDAWENKIKPVLKALGDFINDKVKPAFQRGVEAIGKAWEGIKELAKTPVNFVINSVINPLIGGFNKIAGVFGTTKIDKIPGLAEGGRIPGNSGGRDDRLAQMVGRGGKLLGSIKVASGEFVVNARDTARALPLLRWINGGMKGGPMAAEKRIGRPAAERPGDGSEGWAFAKGGLVGFLDNVMDAISNPKAAILGPVQNALKDIPGGGMIRSLLTGMGKGLANGFVSWLGGAVGGDATIAGKGVGGNLGKAMRFVQAQNGKPYGWANAGPSSYDCSGIVAAAWNILHGRSPYSHTFSTGSLPGPYFPKRGPGGLLTAGWAHPGQRGASANVGHMAGQFVGGMSFESTGSRGVHVNTGRRPSDFAHQGHFAGGGLLGPIAKVARADFGSVTLARGWNMIENATGRPEPLAATGGGEVAELLRAMLAAIEALVPGFAQAMGKTSPGLLRQARRA